MLTIEDYIGKRKKEDLINEFNPDCKQDNLRTCVNYVFEYFNNYLSISIDEQRTVLKDEKVEKYRQSLSRYDLDIQNWLVITYIESDKQVNKTIMSLLAKEDFFHLLSTEAEFRELPYELYAKVVKRIPTLKGQSEMIFLFIKDFHRIKSYEWDFEKYDLPYTIKEWLRETRNKYRVDPAIYAERWVEYLFNHENIWPWTHKRKSLQDYIDYEYDYKQKTNLFNLDDLYRKMPKKAYIRGKKQELEILMMYFWLHNIVSDEDYWPVYLQKVLPPKIE